MWMADEVILYLDPNPNSAYRELDCDDIAGAGQTSSVSVDVRYLSIKYKGEEGNLGCPVE